MKNYLKLFFPLIILFAGVSANATGQQKLLSESAPWIVNTDKFLLINFRIKTKEIEPFLKIDIALKADKDGFVNTMMEVYSAENISGIPEYHAAFIVVETESHTSRDGAPGHYAIWGIVSPDQSAKFFHETLGFPYKPGTVKIESKKPKFIASIGDNTSTLLEIEATEISDKPFAGKGFINMLATKSNHLFKMEVPYLTDGFLANIPSFKVTTNKDPLLNLLNSTSPTWAIISHRQIFSYLYPIQLKK